jgi:hypothetical protein
MDGYDRSEARPSGVGDPSDGGDSGGGRRWARRERLGRPVGRCPPRLAIVANSGWQGAEEPTGGGSGLGILLGPRGALWERTPIQPSPQDCSNWFVHANGSGLPFATLTNKSWQSKQITMGVAAAVLRRSRGQTNPQDRPQRSWGRHSATECRGRRGVRVSGAPGTEDRSDQGRVGFKARGSRARNSGGRKALELSRNWIGRYGSSMNAAMRPSFGEGHGPRGEKAVGQGGSGAWGLAEPESRPQMAGKRVAFRSATTLR